MTAWGLVLLLAGAVLVVPLTVLAVLVAYKRWMHRRSWDAHADGAVAVGNGGRCPWCLIEVEDMAQHRRLRHSSGRQQPDREKL